LKFDEKSILEKKTIERISSSHKAKQASTLSIHHLPLNAQRQSTSSRSYTSSSSSLLLSVPRILDGCSWLPSLDKGLQESYQREKAPSMVESNRKYLNKGLEFFPFFSFFK
jgi:hypothetical protein